MKQDAYFKSPRLIVVMTAILLGTVNIFLAPKVMSLMDEGIAPSVSSDEHGNVVVHQLDLSEKVNRFILSQLPSIVICSLVGIVLGTLLRARWLRFSLLFSVVFCLTPFLFAPLNLIIFFTGFDAATPLDIWLQEIQALAIIAASAVAGAWAGSRYASRRQNKVQH